MRADDRIAQLTERIAELESDAARYLYLKTMFSPMGINIDGNHTWTFRNRSNLAGGNIDEAVDRAIVKQVADTAILADYLSKKEEVK